MPSEPGCPQCDGVGSIPVAGRAGTAAPCPTCKGADETTVVYECQTCWARAATPDDIRHQPVIEHPAEPQIERLEFPILDRPSPGLFGHQETDTHSSGQRPHPGQVTPS